MPGPNVLKLSVHANGDLLLNGEPATMVQIQPAIENLAKEGGIIWYYRENSAEGPPPATKEILDLVVKYRLPIRLSSKPDFSDSIGPPQSPLDQMFAQIRQRAAQGILMMLRPDGKPMMLSVQKAAALPPEALESVNRLLPPEVKRNVAVIGDTAWTMGASPDMVTANDSIPFFGMLMGLGAIGHAVWVFDAASPQALAAGCRDADLVIVDSARLDRLPPDWQSMIVKAMRGRDIVVHDRTTYKLRKA
jgi:hypothetical protein